MARIHVKLVKYFFDEACQSIRITDVEEAGICVLQRAISFLTASLAGLENAFPRVCLKRESK